MLHTEYERISKRYEQLVSQNNQITEWGNGIYERFANPVLTREHIPPFWRYDLNSETNPFFMERLGVNSVFNSGAIKLGDKYFLLARIEGVDRKSFFGVAESTSPTQGFRFWNKPVELPDIYPEEIDVYDIRLTRHEDGWIYGTFCSESRDKESGSTSGAFAQCGIVRTKDLRTWERLPNLKTIHSPQQRNVVIHPEFVCGKYAFYTRPMASFSGLQSGEGIGFGLCDEITNPVVDEEIIISPLRFHTVYEVKNGAGVVPIRTDYGWIHIAHGVRGTAAGRRYVLYAFATDLKEPWRTIAEPGGYLIAPMMGERVGDCSNVVFTNGSIDDDDGNVYIYYASSDTRLHVAKTNKKRLIDFVFNTPEDALRSPDCVKQRLALIERNLELLSEIKKPE